ncbi:MAG: hypothetical protein RLY31_133 [Bacteroidota bacterium]
MGVNIRHVRHPTIADEAHMENSHLIALLRSLEKEEVRALRKWAASPAHNTRQDVSDLLDYLTRGDQLRQSQRLAKERVFRVLYPGKEYRDADMRQVMHFLRKLVESFLVYRELAADTVRSQAMLCRAFRKRHLPELFQRAMAAGQALQADQPYRNRQYFENEYLLQLERYSYLSGQGRNVPLNLQEVSDANDLAYLANKLQLSCIMFSHQAVYKTRYATPLLDSVTAHVESEADMLRYPAIAVYYYSYMSLSHPGEPAYFRALKEQLGLHQHLFPPEEMRVLYLLAINYCIARINAGETAFYQETFDLFREGLERKLLLENGQLSRFTFSNAVLSGLNLQRYDWVRAFLQDYGPCLPDRHRAAYVGFYTARLLYEQGAYGAAMQLIAPYEYDDILMNLQAKTILLKIYYELDELNALDSLLDSMSAYLQRKQVMGYHRTIYKNLLRYTRKLLRLPGRGGPPAERLREEIRSAEPLMEKKWLLAQLEALR